MRLAWDLELFLCFVVFIYFCKLHYTLTPKMSCVARIVGGNKEYEISIC